MAVFINKVTKKYLTGNLKNMEIIERTFHPFELTKIYIDCMTGNKYMIVNMERVLFEHKI